MIVFLITTTLSEVSLRLSRYRQHLPHIMGSTHRNTALSLISGFEDLSIDKLVSTRSPTCTHHFAPASLHMGTKDNDAFTEHIKHLRQVIAQFPVTPKDVMEDEKQHKVMVWATGRPEFYAAVKDDEWEDWGNEYIFVLTMNEAGDRVEEIVEFLDSKSTERGRALVKRAFANFGRGQGDA